MDRLQKVNRKPYTTIADFDKPRPSIEPREMSTEKASGNPTPIATCGLFVAFGTLACQLLFSHDTVSIDTATVPAHLFFGGILITLGGALELCLRHYVPALALTSLGLFCFPFSKTLLPALSTGVQGMASGDGIPPTMEIKSSALILGMILLVYLVSSFRTNLALVLTLFSLDLGVALAAGAYWLYGGQVTGESDVGKKMLVEAGICFIAASACSFWILFSTLLEAVDFPFTLPLGSLSKAPIRPKTNVS
ncbi:hypothetical protein FDECE_3748 [Fusarium decemcellulare]|nr:hypothetical protein FDECE_3748 [Fusarium decemcellulare]